MALANIIKEVDPPVELTQAEYDALNTAQKNDGTVYFITDGNGAFQTAATTPAEDTSGGTSNVQDELQKKVEKADVVNNFTTTQEGYVADARALKTIADNYSLKTDLEDISWEKITLGTHATVTVQNLFNSQRERRVILVGHPTQSSVRGIYLVSSKNVNTIIDASDLSLTISNDVLTITNNGGYAPAVTMI